MHSEDECTKFYPEYKDESCIDVGFTEYCAWDYGGHFFLQPEDYARICADDKVLFGCHSIASGLKPPDYKILYELCYDEAKTISKKDSSIAIMLAITKMEHATRMDTASSNAGTNLISLFTSRKNGCAICRRIRAF